MAKGQAAKQEAMATMLEVFQDSFLYNGNKEVRINTIEDGEPVQLKVVITAAKVPVTAGDENAIPTPTTSVSSEGAASEIKATEEEKQNVANLMEKLGF